MDMNALLCGVGSGVPVHYFTANEFDFVSRIEDLNEQGRVLCSQGAGRDNKCSEEIDTLHVVYLHKEDRALSFLFCFPGKIEGFRKFSCRNFGV